MNMHTNGTRTRRARRAFSLIELLVTMAVIAIVIAIIVPTLGGARNTAKAAASQAQLTAIGAASQQFYTDKTRLPGYFTARQMGDRTNEDRGFTGMQNVMLDLAGGFATASSDPTNIVSVGPISGQEIDIDLTLVGTKEAGGGYYTPEDTRYIPQEVGSGLGVLETTVQDHRELRSVVDPFGTPILAWQQDGTAIQDLEEIGDFSAFNSNGEPARFYWASNAGFLKTEELGKRGKNPTFSASTAAREHSLIGNSEPDLAMHLAVLLGSPTIPNTINGAVPSSARGNLVFHAAGIDAMYMGSKDKGGRASEVAFWQSFWSDMPDGTRLTDNDGKVESVDLLDRFDDQLESIGN
ncbi:MAG: prepilin-type N-terminal cleavage/methylation domain-containing protein [Phycisphaerales bacterium]|jgi:prepilin-type N-terminal cleavage/methylation domain-containing protein